MPQINATGLGRIGRADYARAISSVWKDDHTPEGWHYLGSGSYRDAYLGPDKVVYKVMGADWYSDNQDEHATSKAIWEAASIPAIASLLERVYVPRTSLYGSVLAMEYTPGTKCEDEDGEDDIPNDVRDALDGLGIYDCHGENVLWQGGKLRRYVVVDLGTSDSGAVVTQLAMQG